MVEEKERVELDRRMELFRGDHPLPSVHHRTIILVDDGLATGATMRAAIEWSSVHGAARVIVAVPVASKPALEELEKNPDCDRVVCLYAPEPFYAVGVWYADFTPTSTEEVRELFERRRFEVEREGFPSEAYKR
jgi:putative phosphoribosyl transferase